MSTDQGGRRCEERRDLILYRLAGVLEANEAVDIDAHLETGCPRCAGAVAEARALIDSLQAGLDPVTPPPSAKLALMQRVRADIAEQERFVDPTPEQSAARVLTHPSWWRPAAAAALAAGLTLVAVLFPMRAQMREQLQAQNDRFEARLEEQRRELTEVQTQLAQAREVASLLHSRSVQLVSMQASEPQPEAWGRIVWDRTQGVWQLYTFDMSPAGPDRTYELWFITADDRKIPAGTFDVDSTGVGALRVVLPDGLGDVAVAAITDEPAGGVPQPTGSIQLVAELGT